MSIVLIDVILEYCTRDPAKFRDPRGGGGGGGGG